MDDEQYRRELLEAGWERMNGRDDFWRSPDQLGVYSGPQHAWKTMKSRQKKQLIQIQASTKAEPSKG